MNRQDVAALCQSPVVPVVFQKLPAAIGCLSVRAAGLLRSALAWLFSPRPKPAHWLVFGLVLAASLALQWRVGQGFVTQTNLDRKTCDQASYMRMTELNLNILLPTVTDGIRNPLFPWLLKPWYAQDREVFFPKAKTVNVVFGMIGSVVLGSYFLLRLPLLPAVFLTVLGTYAAILPISVLVGAEVVFYLTFFFLWICYCRLLAVDCLPTYAIGGFVCALAYLAKPSTLLLTLVFLLLSSLRLMKVWEARKLRRFTICGSLFLICFLLPVLPRACYSQQLFGDPFESISAYCFWKDSWDEAYPHLRYYSKRRIGELPESERPSLGNYWRSHSVQQMTDRMLEGIPAQARNFFLPENRIKSRKKPSPETRLLVPRRGAYPLALLSLTLILGFTGGKIADAPEQRRARLALWALSGVAFVLHFAAFSFYTPLASGARFIMGTYLPVIFALAAGLESLRKSFPPGWREALYRAAYLAMAIALFWNLLPLTHATVFGEVNGAF